MIINIDKGLIKYVLKNKLENDTNLIRSINNFLKISDEKQHLVIIDSVLIDFLLQTFNTKLDASSLNELNNLKLREPAANKIYLRSFPLHVNVTANESIKENEIKVIDNSYYNTGKIFEVNIYSLCKYNFLGNNVTILSENDKDVKFYSQIGIKYLIENFQHFIANDFIVDPGYGGNIENSIRTSIQNRQKTLVICDTDKKSVNHPIKSKSTLDKAISAYNEYKHDNFIYLISLDAHEKENLIPVSWLKEVNKHTTNCVNTSGLEQCSFNDRLLYLDFKKGLTKKKYDEDMLIKEYFDPAISNLEIDLDELSEEDFIFSKIANNDWDKWAIKILNSKKLSDFPGYLRSNIDNIGIHVACWLVGGRRDTSQAKRYIVS
ncbi:hypothetical protein [Exiguobacterium sp. s78]|uniref:hypothetical protein n=1 Tax=Exiguobacterium sp. s78 TaxID=2751197 RepID=UPI001BE62652|nr:hypothetical protein [Exiguobacterium sp. s78]